MRPSHIFSLVVAVVGSLLLLVGVLAAGWKPLLGLDLQGGTEVVLQANEPADNESLDQAAEVIRSRVDAIGVAEPDITRQGDSIVVQLPGVQDADRARDLVGRTAELRFRPVLSPFDPNDPAQRAAAADQLDQLISQMEEAEAASTSTPQAGQEGASTTVAPAALAPTTTATAAAGAAQEGAATTLSATTAPTSAAPTTQAGQEGASSTVAPTTPTTAFDPAAAPTIEEIVTPADAIEDDQPIIALDNLGEVGYLLAPAAATGDIVGGASADFINSWFVMMDFTGEGNDRFNEVASDFVGQQLAVELDGVVYSAPTIEATEFDGQATITGAFTEQEAKDLALILRFGALPVELEELSARNVSATLGQNALDAGLVAGLIGMLLVAGYMILYYRLLGLVAVGGLMVSGTLLYTLIAWMGESRGLAVTLAGLTGIVVSIGVQVDSNVVYYERIKEEVRRGRSVRSAAEGGYGSALSTIITADTASLIGAALLYYLSVGSVHGFALFLGLATVLDLVVSVVFMRPAVLWLARSRFADKPSRLGLVPPDPAPLQEVTV